jgi:Tol biopolymer transport system component
MALLLRKKGHLLFLTLILFLGACRQNQVAAQIRVKLIADGRERTFDVPTATTIDEFLHDPKVDVQYSELDIVNPPPFTQIADGMQITIARVSEKEECETTEVPYKQTPVLNEGLKPGEKKVVKAGQAGSQETCYRVTVIDGTPKDRVVTRITEIKAAQDEIIYIGVSGDVEPVPITGTLAYKSNGNVWIIEGSSTSKKPITTEGDLDTHVFVLSPNGRQLLFTRKADATDANGAFNHLWMISDVTRPTGPVSLVLDNILYADWIPELENTISYSAAEPSQATPGWLPFHDLWQMRVDPDTGESLGVKQLLKRSGGGLYGWWATRFQWSPDGKKLAWAQADKIGIFDADALLKGDINGFDASLVKYAVLVPFSGWSWRSTLAWSPDDSLLLSTTHGAPVGNESPENSPSFNISVTDTTGTFQSSIVLNAGIWSAPQFSPILTPSDSKFPKGYMAYLRARDSFNSINGEYDLVVADRDGSNARVLFPGDGRTGLTAQESIFQDREFTWSPDGHQIAIIYQGNLWIVDAESGITHQLTLDGRASNPIWAK